MRPLRGRVVLFLAGAMLVLLAGCRNESASAPQDAAPAASTPSEPGVQAAGERVMPESGAPPLAMPEPGPPPATPEATDAPSAPSTDTTGKTPGAGATPVVPPPRSSDEQVTTTLSLEPAPERDVRDDVEAFYAGLPEEAIAFHVPATVPRGQLFTVRLIVEPGKSEAEIARVLVEMARDAGPGEVRTRTARVGDEMQALLSSPTLQIVTRGNDTQLVRRSGVTEWAWDVTATTGGTHRLALTLYAIPQGRGSGLKVKTFEETLAVEVGFADEIKETLSEHWEWMWTFVLGPVGALVWRRHRRLARAPE